MKQVQTSKIHSDPCVTYLAKELQLQYRHMLVIPCCAAVQAALLCCSLLEHSACTRT
jgi:hypothetical protein